MAQPTLAEFPRWSYFSESHLDEEEGKDKCQRQTGYTRAAIQFRSLTTLSLSGEQWFSGEGVVCAARGVDRVAA